MPTPRRPPLQRLVLPMADKAAEADPVNQKYALLPAFLQAKGLIRQHVSRLGHS